MSYGPTVEGRLQRAADYEDRILQGAKLAELSVEQPTTFQVAINLKTAKTIGLTVPPLVLLQADKVMQ